MNLLPLELKHYVLDIGISHVIRADDVPVKLYTVQNKVTGIVEYEDINLPAVYEIALGMDRNMERAIDYKAKNIAFEHLDGCLDESDDVAGSIALPAYMTPDTVQ